MRNDVARSALSSSFLFVVSCIGSARKKFRRGGNFRFGFRLESEFAQSTTALTGGGHFAHFIIYHFYFLKESSFDVNSKRHSGGNLLVHVLVEQGRDIDSIFFFFRFQLPFSGRMKSVPWLLSLCEIQKAKVNVFNLDGMTPLAIAADRGDVFMVETLVALAGADPNLANSQTGLTPLHYAARKDDLLMIK